MLSAYELNGRKDAALLANAQRLGDKLMFGWVPANGPIPCVIFFGVRMTSTVTYQRYFSDTAPSIFRRTPQMLVQDRFVIISTAHLRSSIEA